MGLRPLEICCFFSAGTVLIYTSESDVYRRQILTYKDGPRAERVKLYTSWNVFSNFNKEADVKVHDGRPRAVRGIDNLTSSIIQTNYSINKLG